MFLSSLDKYLHRLNKHERTVHSESKNDFNRTAPIKNIVTHGFDLENLNLSKKTEDVKPYAAKVKYYERDMKALNQMLLMKHLESQ